MRLITILALLLPALSNAATFGKTSIGGTGCLLPVDAGGIAASKFTLSEAGTVTKLTAYWNAASTTIYIRGVIYTSTGANSPGTLVAQTNEVSAISSGWNDLTFASSVQLSAGDYYLGAVATSAKDSMCDATGDNVYTQASYTQGGNAPSSWPAGGSSANQRSIYATYTAEGPIGSALTAGPACAAAVTGLTPLGQTGCNNAIPLTVQ